MKSLENILKLLRGEYVSLEVWSNSYKGKELRNYIDKVIKDITSSYPSIDMLSVRKSKYLESRVCPYLAFPGYIIKISSGLSLTGLKEKCVALELDEKGKRISDIDVYYKNKKISRKT